MTRLDWQAKAAEWRGMRMGIAGAESWEFCAGYVNNFKPVFVLPGPGRPNEHWYVWMVFPGDDQLMQRVVTEIYPGSYLDHEGNLLEHDPAWVLCLGTVTRIGSQPLLSPEMFGR